MIDFFHRLGRRLWRWRGLLWALGVLGALAVPAAVLGVREDGAHYVFAALALLMWAVCLLMTAYGFAAPPPTIEPGARWLRRCQVRVRRAGLHFAAVLTVVLTLLVAYASLRALLMLLRGG